MPSRPAINIAAAGGPPWERLCEALEAPEMLERENFATPALRNQNRDEVNDAIDAVTRTKPSAHWLKVLNDAGVPCGPINNIGETFAEPQVQHLGMAARVDHPDLGVFDVVGQPINMSGAPQPDELKPTPNTGQHTDEILEWLGYGQADIDALRKKVVV